MIFNAIYNPRNKQMTDFQMLSRRQVELVFCIRDFRKSHELTLKEFAHRCTCFGKPFNTKFAETEISKYERFQTIPKEKKMNIMMMAIGIKMEDLDKRK